MAESTTKSGARSRARNTASANKNELSAELAALRADVDAVTERLGKIANAGAREARDRRDRSASAVRETTSDLLDELSRQIADLERQTGSAVRRHPLQSLGIAAGLGFLAALLMRR